MESSTGKECDAVLGATVGAKARPHALEACGLGICMSNVSEFCK